MSSNPPHHLEIGGSDTIEYSMTLSSVVMKDCYLKKCITEETTATVEIILNGMGILAGLWDTVQMQKEAKITRVHAAHQHLRNLVEDMILSEKEMVSTVKSGIKEKEDQIKKFRRELQMEEWSREDVWPSIALLRAAEKEEEALRERFDSLMAEQETYVQRMDLLCFRLGKNPQNYLPAPGTLFPRSSLENLQNQISLFGAELTSRLRRATRMQKDLRSWCRVLGKDYGDHQEEDLKVFLVEDLNSDDFQLTKRIMDRLEQFWTDFSKMYKSWLEEMDWQWTNCYEELKELWKQCHIQASFPPRFDPSRHSQEDIDQMVHEIVRLTALYAARQPVYKLLEDWQEAWKQKLSIGEKKKEPDYYQSRERGHNLWKDVQMEKHLNEVRLPALKQSLARIYEDYKRNYPMDQIRVDGYEPIELVEWMEAEHHLNIERTRSAKAVKRKQIFQRDALRTPLKVKSGVRTPTTPATAPEKRPRLSTELEMSMIGPIREEMDGPRTSSPKKKQPSPVRTPQRRNFRALPRRI